MRWSIGVLLVASLAVASGHVIAVYQGMNLPIRGAGRADEAQTTDGPCGGANTFGSSGTSTMAPGELVNLQLKYAQNHRIAGGNSFMVAMVCVKSNPTTLGDQNQYRLSQAANQKNRVALETVNVPDEGLYSMPLQLPAVSPAGVKLEDGDYCTLSIMDQRDWGGCVDIKVSSNPGPIIAGVVAPVVTIAAAALAFKFRGRVASKLAPAAGAANPDRKMWDTIKWTFVLTVFTIICCAAPAWSQGSGWRTGPWLYCPSSNAACSSSSTLLGFESIYAVRFFVLAAVILTAIALLLPVVVYQGYLDATIAAKVQMGCHLITSICSFCAFIVWVSVFGGGSNPGWALYIDIITFAWALACLLVSYSWKSHIEEGAKSLPTTTTEVAKTVPLVSTPTTTPSFTSGPKAYATNAGNTTAYSAAKKNHFEAVPAAAEVTYPKKFGNWEEIWDEENSAYYFFNHANGSSSWDRPAGWPTL